LANLGGRYGVLRKLTTPVLSLTSRHRLCLLAAATCLLFQSKSWRGMMLFMTY
jgi:hypothetical protein